MKEISGIQEYKLALIDELRNVIAIESAEWEASVKFTYCLDIDRYDIVIGITLFVFTDYEDVYNQSFKFYPTLNKIVWLTPDTVQPVWVTILMSNIAFDLRKGIFPVRGFRKEN